jgi:putative intracellular protease/amidase
MKKLFCLLLLSSILVSFEKSAPKVLLFIKEGSSQLEYMLTNEVGKMSELIKQAGFDVIITTISGEELKEGSISIKPALKLKDVNINDYEGIILPCMTLDLSSPEMIALVRSAADKGKPVAAQAGSVVILAKAGLLTGKKYALNIDAGDNPDFAGAVYGGKGVVKDGIIITSGTCPWLAKQTGDKDGTPELTKIFTEAIKSKTK